MSLGIKGSQDWLLQRLSAVILAAYFIFLIVYCMVSFPIEFSAWHALFQKPWFKMASLLTVVSLSLHAWLGLWIVITDYIKWLSLRLVVMSVILLAILSYLLWGISILWGL